MGFLPLTIWPVFFHLRQSFEEIRDTIQEAVQTDTRTIEKIEAMAHSTMKPENI